MDFVLGIDIGGTFTKLALLDRDRGLLGETRVRTEAERGSESLVERVAAAAQELASGSGDLALAQAGAVGVGVAGLVEEASGLLLASPNLPGWEGFAAAGAMQRALAVEEVVVENDANACALAEATYGAGRGCDPIALLNLGTGVGGGLVEGGRIVHGKRGFAGELGHMAIVVDGGPYCACAARGCVESFLRAEAVVALAHDLAASSTEPASPALAQALASGEATARAVGEAAVEGDPVALAVFSELGRHLGVAIANLISALNPEAVIVGGGVAQAGETLIGVARKTAMARVMPPLADATAILPAALGDRGGMLGAALLALARSRHNPHANGSRGPGSG
jgi:glucokinase